MPAGSLARACTILGFTILTLVILAAVYGYYRHQGAGVLAALMAGVICGVPALAALVVTVSYAGGGPQALTGVLGGIFLRTGVPFAGLVFLPQLLPWLKDAGMPGMVLGMYLPVLGVETLLAVRLVKQRSPRPGEKKISG